MMKKYLPVKKVDIVISNPMLFAEKLKLPETFFDAFKTSFITSTSISGVMALIIFILTSKSAWTIFGIVIATVFIPVYGWAIAAFLAGTISFSILIAILRKYGMSLILKNRKEINCSFYSPLDQLGIFVHALVFLPVIATLLYKDKKRKLTKNEKEKLQEQLRGWGYSEEWIKGPIFKSYLTYSPIKVANATKLTWTTYEKLWNYKKNKIKYSRETEPKDMIDKDKTYNNVPKDLLNPKYKNLLKEKINEIIDEIIPNRNSLSENQKKYIASIVEL